MVPGFYTTRVKTIDGWTRSVLGVSSVRLDTGEKYDIRSHPLVQSLSTNQISSDGGIINIAGSGFGFV